MDTQALFDPETYLTGVPYPLLRELPPVSWVPDPGFWAVTRHADVRTVLRDPRLFSSHLGATQVRDPATPEDLRFVRQMMLNMDPPDHSRLRGLLNKAFTPRAVAGITERIQGWARDLVANAPAECDFAKDIAADLPLLTLAEVFGVPEQDRRLMFDWSNRVIGFQDSEYAISSTVDESAVSEMARAALALRPEPDAEGRMPDPRSREGMPDLYAYAHALGEYKRAHPTGDVMSNLMSHVDDDGGRVSLTEFENLFWLFAVAGNETLRNGLPGGMYALLSNPDQYARLRANPDLLDTAVDEMLRWWTPVMHFRRTATADTELSGVDIRRGDRVVVWFSAANRDPAVFAEPDRFDIGRKPNDHLTFGHGPHFCLGAYLAKTQMRALFTEVLRIGEIRLAGRPARLRSNFQHGLKSLPVTIVRSG
ncbi:cytochrome P450 [Pseudonocardiaceae bacterium YIM PH 21723]|nr:cytochrome P450 [Pseudonocardiaceae bacterium YIM PH 21723]